jgi:hypothetical protein
VQLSASVKEMTNNGVGISDLLLPHTSPLPCKVRPKVILLHPTRLSIAKAK